MRATAFGLLILLLATSGLSCVPCKHPLSDEKTSKLDERLIGEWRFYEKGKPSEDADPVYVGRLKGHDNVLEIVQCAVDKSGHVVVEHMPLYATSVGSLRLLSMPRDGVKPDRETIYDIALYDMPDKDTLNWYVLDEDAITAAIKKKELAGAFTAEKSAFGRTRNAPRITASPEEMRKFIEKNGKKCFLSEPVTMKRDLDEQAGAPPEKASGKD